MYSPVTNPLTASKEVVTTDPNCLNGHDITFQTNPKVDLITVNVEDITESIAPNTSLTISPKAPKDTFILGKTSVGNSLSPLAKSHIAPPRAPNAAEPMSIAGAIKDRAAAPAASPVIANVAIPTSFQLTPVNSLNAFAEISKLPDNNPKVTVPNIALGLANDINPVDSPVNAAPTPLPSPAPIPPKAPPAALPAPPAAPAALPAPPGGPPPPTGGPPRPPGDPPGGTPPPNIDPTAATAARVLTTANAKTAAANEAPNISNK